MSLSQKQIGDERMAAGNKCARKGWFHRPDYQGAAFEYDKAALAYKNAKEWDLAVAAYKKSAECHKENGVLSASARAFESAAGCCKDGLKDATQCGDFYRLAAEAYHLSNNDERAADVLARGAKAIDTLALKMSDQGKQTETYLLAIELIKDGINFYENSEKLAIYGLKAVKSAITIALRARIAEEAIDLYEKMILICVGSNASNYYNDIHKAALSLVILHLARGDVVYAERVYERECSRDSDGNERTSFIHSDFGKCATKLLDAWDSADQDAVDAVVKSQDVTFLDSELVRIAKKLSVDGESSEIKFVSVGKSSYVPINDEPASIALKDKPVQNNGSGSNSSAAVAAEEKISVGEKREIEKIEQNERNRQLLFGSAQTSSQPKKSVVLKEEDDDDGKDEVKKGGDDDDDDSDGEFEKMLAKKGITDEDHVKIEDYDVDAPPIKLDLGTTEEEEKFDEFDDLC